LVYIIVDPRYRLIVKNTIIFTIDCGES